MYILTQKQTQRKKAVEPVQITLIINRWLLALRLVLSRDRCAAANTTHNTQTRIFAVLSRRHRRRCCRETRAHSSNWNLSCVRMECRGVLLRNDFIVFTHTKCVCRGIFVLSIRTTSQSRIMIMSTDERCMLN